LKTTWNLGRIALQLFEFNSQQRELLVDIVVKLSPDPGAFLLLCFDQFFGKARKSLFCPFDVGYIGYHTDHPQHFAIRIEETTPVAL
jgi:hypothetical protein